MASLRSTIQLSLGCVSLLLFAVLALFALRSAVASPAPYVDEVERQRAMMQLEAERQSVELSMRTEQALAPVQFVALASLWLAIPAGLLLALGAIGNALYQRRRALVLPSAGLLPIARDAVADGATLELAAALLLEQAQTRRLAAVASAERPIMPHTLHYAPHIRNDGAHAQPAQIVEQSATLPTAPAFAELLAGGWQPSMDRFLLGYAAGGPIWGSIDDLLSTLVVGRPGTGKTTLLRLLLAQLVGVGAQVAILDPHGGLADLADVRVKWRAETGVDIEEVGRDLVGELERRLGARREGERCFPPLLVLVDEWNILADVSPFAVNMAKRYILEARKVRGYAVISGQGAPAASFGGSLARDGLSSRYVMWTTAQQARMAGLEPDARGMLAQLEEGPRGRAILARSSDKPIIVAVPNTTAEDLERLAVGTEQGTGRRAGWNQVELVGESGEPDEAARIRAWLAEGWSRNAIASRLGGRREAALDRIRAAEARRG